MDKVQKHNSFNYIKDYSKAESQTPVFCVALFCTVTPGFFPFKGDIILNSVNSQLDRDGTGQTCILKGVKERNSLEN
jgi:hypothetical protein